MMEIVRGGAGGEVRLKLLLSLLWVAVGQPYHAQYPAHVWAALIGVDDPDTRGARRVRHATAWLEDHEFVKRLDTPGRVTTLQPLREDGSGRAFTPAGVVISAEESARGSFSTKDTYFQIPASLWTNRWIAGLSGRSLAVLLMLISEQRGSEEKQVWISPRLIRERFNMSENFRREGIRELEDLRLVQTHRESFQGSALHERRYRNVYEVNHRRLLTHRWASP